MSKMRVKKRISSWWREKQDDDDKFNTFYIISVFMLSMKHYFKFQSESAGKQTLPVQLELSYPSV
jgi:hypothetical protein